MGKGSDTHCLCQGVPTSAKDVSMLWHGTKTLGNPTQKKQQK